MKRGLVITGIILLIILLFFGTINYLDRREANLMFKAQQSGDVTICNKITKVSNKRSCIVGVAIEMKDISICDKHFSVDKEGCYLLVATNLEDISMCEKIENEFESFKCKRAIAVRTNDISICEALTDEGYKNSCIESVETAFK